MMSLQIVFTVLAGGAGVFWLVFASLRPARLDGTDIVNTLEYGRWLRILALSFALAPLTLLVVLSWRLHWRNEQTLALAGALLLGLDLLPALLLVEVTRTRILLSETCVTRISAWRREVSLEWTAIERVRYSPLNRWYEIHGSAGTFRVPRDLVGIEKFLEMARAKVAMERRGNI